MFAEILAIQVSLNGVQQVISGLDDVQKKFEENEKIVEDLQKGLVALAVATGLVVMGLKEMAEGEWFGAKFEGLIESSEIILTKAQMIDEVASRSNFGRPEITAAADEMDRMGVSVQENLRLVEAMASGTGDVASATKVVVDTLNGNLGNINKELLALGYTADQLAEAGISATTPASEALTKIRTLEGLYGDAASAAQEAAYQMRLIDQIASKGIFTETEAFKAVETMNKFGISVERNIGLVEKLGARSGSLESAANLIGMIEAGYTTGLGRRMKEFGIGPDKLRSVGLRVEGNDIKGTSEEILEALRKIEAKDKTLSHLTDTLDAGVGRVKYQFSELVETIGGPFVDGASKVLSIITETFRWMKDLNAVTHGWVSNFLVGGLLITGLIKIIAFLKEIKALEIVISIIAGIRGALQAGPKLLEGLMNVIKFLFSMRAIEAILLGVEVARALVTAAIAWALGNKAAAIGAIALVAAAGFAGAAAVNAVNDYRNKNAPGPTDPRTPASRPIRRDDIEKVYEKMYGNAWTG